MTLVRFTAAFGAAALLALAAPAGARDAGGSPDRTGTMGGAMMSAKKPVTVRLKELNGSGESGTATLSDSKAGLVVVIALRGGTAAPQPAHIHTGSCPNGPAVLYPLKPVVNGTSTTTIPHVTIASIAGKTNVNVHKSAANMQLYVACGNVTKEAM